VIGPAAVHPSAANPTERHTPTGRLVHRVDATGPVWPARTDMVGSSSEDRGTCSKAQRNRHRGPASVLEILPLSSAGP
jgi:hypothetical protein